MKKNYLKDPFINIKPEKYSLEKVKFMIWQKISAAPDYPGFDGSTLLLGSDYKCKHIAGYGIHTVKKNKFLVIVSSSQKTKNL